MKNSDDLRYIILNTKQPLVLKNILNWELLKWTLKDWQNLLKDEKMQFRKGKNSFSRTPQWESKCEYLEGTFEDFLKFTNNPLEMIENWLYFDYKYLNEWFTELPALEKLISWKEFGFPELTSKDSTIWIGSKGAHTTCHMDTYGCNLIAQIYGKKQWILISPENDQLNPTRIPYEESTIYSKLNFFSPNTREFSNINGLFKIVLNPGDVLILPHKWWHYVENLETSISINVWLELIEDSQQRLSESIVQFMVSSFARHLGKNDQKLVNKNLFSTTDCNVNLIEICRNECSKKKNEQISPAKKDFTLITLLLLHKKYIDTIEMMPVKEFHDYINKKQSKENIDDIINQGFNYKLDLFEKIMHPDVINLISKKIME